MYCTYLTIYFGNRLPQFYIGFSYIEKIRKGYRGSVQSQEYKSIWRQELKNHPKLFKTIILTKHENKQEAINKEIYFQKSLKILQKPTIYINRTIGRHSDRSGTRLSEEHKIKISKSSRGRISTRPFFGKKHTEESKQKMRKNHSNISNLNLIPKINKGKKLTEEHKKKISLSTLGKSKSETHRRNISLARISMSSK